MILEDNQDIYEDNFGNDGDMEDVVELKPIGVSSPL